MKIEIVGTNMAAAGMLPPAANGIGRNPLGPRRYLFLHVDVLFLLSMSEQ